MTGSKKREKGWYLMILWMHKETDLQVCETHITKYAVQNLATKID